MGTWVSRRFDRIMEFMECKKVQMGDETRVFLGVYEEKWSLLLHMSISVFFAFLNAWARGDHDKKSVTFLFVYFIFKFKFWKKLGFDKLTCSWFVFSMHLNHVLWSVLLFFDFFMYMKKMQLYNISRYMKKMQPLVNLYSILIY